MTPKTPTIEVVTVYRGKSDLLQMWEAQPLEIRLANEDYIAGLVRRVAIVRKYLEHRKDAPIWS